MKCYQIWFRDGSALLVDADNEANARIEARKLVRGSQAKRIVRVECLTEEAKVE